MQAYSNNPGSSCNWLSELHVISGAWQWVKPAVHACRSEKAVGRTMKKAEVDEFTCFTCLHAPSSTDKFITACSAAAVMQLSIRVGGALHTTA
jgi:hypothetical protein